jgi:DNA-directed RNA polymerase subunit RPC12/RpoP
VTRDDMIADVLATVEEEKAFPGSDLTPAPGGEPEAVVRFRWASGAWLCYVLVHGQGPSPWPEDRPWPAFAVDAFVSGGGRLVPAQLATYRARPCQLHLPDSVETCGCPTMYEVLAGEMKRRSEAKLREIAAAADAATVAPPAASAPASSTPSDVGPGAGAPAAPGLLWSFRCLDCGRTELLPSVPAGRGEACPECEHAGVFLHRADQVSPPHASFADVIARDGVLEEPGGGACYVCGGPLAQPGGKCARLRGGFVRAHLACVQEKRDKKGFGVEPFVRVGDPKGYCHACKAPFRGGDLTILGGKAHALFSLCQAGPTPPATAPAGRTLGRAMKEKCVVCEREMVKGHVVTPHLDGTAHMLCVTVPEKQPQSFDAVPP